MKKGGKQKRGLTIRCDDVTPGMIAAAVNRTRPVLHNLHLIDYDLSRLVQSCYLQGARDMAETIIKNPSVIPVPDCTDWQI